MVLSAAAVTYIGVAMQAPSLSQAQALLIRPGTRAVGRRADWHLQQPERTN